MDNPIPNQEAKALNDRLVSLRNWINGLNAEAMAVRCEAMNLIEETRAALAACFAGSGEAEGSKDPAATESLLPADPVIVAAKRLKP